MFNYLSAIWVAVLLCATLSESQKNECLESDYSEDSSETVFKCRKGCVGVVPNCVPYCINGCPVNSVCHLHNICKCNAGYTTNETDLNVVPSLKSCKFVCELKCPDHSHCVDYSTCECDAGYVENVINPDVKPSLQSCKATCKTKCPDHSFCTSWNTCECLDGYTSDEIDLNGVPSLQSCREIQDNISIALHIIIYILLACALVMATFTVILIIVMRSKKGKYVIPMELKMDS